MVEYRDPGTLTFDAVIKRSDVAGSSAFVPVPLDVPELFGTAGRVPVHATFNDEPYRGSLVPFADGHLLPVASDIEERTGCRPGDSVRVKLSLDASVRVVELDADVLDAFAAAGVLPAYRAMASSHQREFAQWIGSASSAELRARRIGGAIDMIADGLRLT